MEVVWSFCKVGALATRGLVRTVVLSRLVQDVVLPVQDVELLLRGVMARFHRIILDGLTHR